MRCLCRPGWACSFLFLLFLAFPANLSPSENGIGFLAPGVCRCPRIRSQLGHTPPTGPVWGFAGVALPLLGLQNRTQGHTGASLGFLSRTNSPLPLKGEGLDIACLGFVESALLVHNWLTRLQQGLFGAALVSLPTWLSKSHTGPHRGGFGFGLLAGDSEEDCL